MGNDRKSLEKDLTELDIDFIRVLEDLIDALITNGSLRLTDLPEQAIDKLNKRKSIRKKLSNALDWIEDDDSII